MQLIMKIYPVLRRELHDFVEQTFLKLDSIAGFRYDVDAAAYENLPASRSELHDLGVIRISLHNQIITEVKEHSSQNVIILNNIALLRLTDINVMLITLMLYKKGAFGESNSGPLAPKARIIPLDQIPILKIKKGAFGESNSGPLAPKARIIPLDQMPCGDMLPFVIMLLHDYLMGKKMKFSPRIVTTSNH
ncbi:hypothetical protein MTR_1g106105 [Medicago truncatula]|uniref:Uncharacterized protein n=1 Tax=Medicago truncatula TaxID=3880 RepID=A0A072VQS2_MEDTR|nr:hypothetical protein MTR_1g106105 [Medicago truncatula]